MPGRPQIENGASTVTTIKRTNEQIRKAKSRIDGARLNAATDAEISRWKKQGSLDDATLAPARLVSAGPDVRLLRECLGLSQEAFAECFHLSLRTVQEWEQRRRVRPARVLLRVIERDPEAVERALAPGT